MLTASPGFRLMVADYAAIEARVVLWLAGAEAGLRVFREGKDIYCDMAETVYNRPINKKDDPDERQMGKQAILGLGFGMGAPKFQATCAKYGIEISLSLARKVVKAYREKYPEVKAMWKQQEEAAILAVRSGRTVQAGLVEWRKVGRFLHAKLPSGRLLTYVDPLVRKDAMYMFPALDMEGEKCTVLVTVPQGKNQDARARREAMFRASLEGSKIIGEAPKWEDSYTLTFMGTDPGPSKKWVRLDTYGGHLVENLVQAIARDILAEAMLRADAGGYFRLVMSVHDEIVAEVPDDGRPKKEWDPVIREFEKLVAAVPYWAPGCPIDAEGWHGKRYRK
jgi:DNA polymerase